MTDVDVPSGLRWTARAGAWTAIAASPASLALGAGLAARTDGPLPLVTLVAGGAGMVTVLWLQGQLGLARPIGEGSDATTALRSMLGPRALHGVATGLGIAMIGWFGFNVGLAGAGAAALTGLPGPLAAVIVGVGCTAIAVSGIRRWNIVALCAAASATVLTALVLTWTDLAATWPIALTAVPAPRAVVTEAAVLVGYVAVFAVRSPDFSHGLAGRAQLARCVALLVGTTMAFIMAGATLWLATGASDVVAHLSGSGNASLGNALVVVALIAPTLTAVHSGHRALAQGTGLPPRLAVAVLATAGTVLAAARFDLWLLSWLGLLAAALPPLIAPLAVERRCRQRGGTAATVPWWTWLPGSAVATGLAATGVTVAPLVGVVLGLGCTAIWARARRPPSRR